MSDNLVFDFELEDALTDSFPLPEVEKAGSNLMQVVEQKFPGEATMRDNVLVSYAHKGALPTHFSFPEMEKGGNNLAQVVEQKFHWFNELNKQEALLFLPGFLFVLSQKWDNQVELYQQKIVEAAAKDMVDRTSALMRTQAGYSGMVYYHEGYLSEYTKKIEGPIFKKGNREYQWLYQKIEDYPALIPPQALQAIALLTQASIRPSHFWVGDLKEVYSSKLVDPVISAQFGRWFVSIAEWA